jgi:hypothetical protein
MDREPFCLTDNDYENKNTRKNTFEPPKKPVNKSPHQNFWYGDKGKTPAFADVNPIWLPGPAFA